MKRTRLILREIQNYFFLKKIIKSCKSQPSSRWNQLNLRNDWLGRIYTVVNLREEDMGEEPFVQDFKATQLIKPINEYLASLDLTEIIFPSLEKIPDSRSYLIVYSPLFKQFTFSWVFWKLVWISIITVATVISIKYFS